jgi:hypothetical protein
MDGSSCRCCWPMPMTESRAYFLRRGAAERTYAAPRRRSRLSLLLASLLAQRRPLHRRPPSPGPWCVPPLDLFDSISLNFTTQPSNPAPCPAAQFSPTGQETSQQASTLQTRNYFTKCCDVAIYRQS